MDDFIVILQKLTHKDPVTLKTLMSSRLIETLNNTITIIQTKEGGTSDSSSEFVTQNIKSILKNIRDA